MDDPVKSFSETEWSEYWADGKSVIEDEEVLRVDGFDKRFKLDPEDLRDFFTGDLLVPFIIICI